MGFSYSHLVFFVFVELRELLEKRPKEANQEAYEEDDDEDEEEYQREL